MRNSADPQDRVIADLRSEIDGVRAQLEMLMMRSTIKLWPSSPQVAKPYRRGDTSRVASKLQAIVHDSLLHSPSDTDIEERQTIINSMLEQQGFRERVLAFRDNKQIVFEFLDPTDEDTYPKYTIREDV
jgi:hypothetical protein